MGKGQKIKTLEVAINQSYILRTHCARKSESRSEWDNMIIEFQFEHRKLTGRFYYGWKEYVCGGQYKT